MTLRDYQVTFVTEARKRHGDIISKKEAYQLASDLGMRTPMWFTGPKYRVSHGKFRLPSADGVVNEPTVEGPRVPNSSEPLANTDSEVVSNVVSIDTAKEDGATVRVVENLIPRRDDLYVPFGFARNLEKIVRSNNFLPVMITGLSGNGKTFMSEQTAARTAREVIRVNITVETDEDDLIGGFRLINGETLFFKGPVIKAMERGAILILDEIDLGHPSKIMCLQSILEGSPYFIKKTGEMVYPAPGFTIIGTANTKMKGSEDGRFIGTNVLNEAFIERFAITVEQEYPSSSVEKKILSKVFDSLNLDPESTFINRLVDWADIIRKTFKAGGVDEVISTRRLVHIAKTYAIFDDRLEAVKLCLNRFDDATKESFLSFYTAIDDEATKSEAGVGAAPESEDYWPNDDKTAAVKDEYIPF